MHDLVHDLAQSIAGQECLYLEDANMTSQQSIRVPSTSTHHISVHPDYLLSIDKDAFKKVESLRTFFELKRYAENNHHYFPTNCFLRVLRTSFIHVPSLGSLIHLRYLELYKLVIETLPDSIYNLKKLEILKIGSCLKLSCLPNRLACLQNLRHLVVKDCPSLSRMFPNIGKITCLRTLSLYIVSLEKGNSLAELYHLNLGGKLSIKELNNVSRLSEAQDANLMGKKDLQEIQLSWKIMDDEFTKTPTINAEQVLEVLQPHSNLKSLEIDYYEGLFLPSWITILSNIVSLVLMDCKNCVQLPSLGKLQSLKRLILMNMDNIKYLDYECHDGMDVRVFPSLEYLDFHNLQNIEGLLKVERGVMFPCLSYLIVHHCPKLGLPCLPSLKYLRVNGCNNELLRSISTLRGLTFLRLAEGDEGITSFPEGMFTNLTFLQTLSIEQFPKLKELPNQPFNLALEYLVISSCDELESLPEHIWESLQSLQKLTIRHCKGLLCLSEGIQHLTSLEVLVIWGCEGLRCLPEGIRHLTSLEVLEICNCPTLKERCKEGTGEDWDKISHIPRLRIWG